MLYISRTVSKKLLLCNQLPSLAFFKKKFLQIKLKMLYILVLAIFSAISVQEVFGNNCGLDLRIFRQQALTAHNNYRARHRAPPLSLDNKLNNIAQAYAQKQINYNQFKHSGNGYGENLYRATGSKSNGAKPVDSWYKEVKNYTCNAPGFKKSTGHFTQVVWASSKQVGIGAAMTRDCKKIIVVANYNPAGNVKGRFPSNVFCTSARG